MRSARDLGSSIAFPLSSVSIIFSYITLLESYAAIKEHDL
jgi:hypothetical protein